MEEAFEAGYDPALELATHLKRKITKEEEAVLHDLLETDISGPWTQHLRRKEQDIVDQIVHGAETGHYYMFLGAKVRSFSLTRNTVKVF